MKNHQKIAVLMVPLFFAAFQVVSAMEAGGAGVPIMTFKEFKASHSGTKPSAIFRQYQEYKRVQNAPQPTLDVSRMRTDDAVYNPYSGTKPSVKWMNRNRPVRELTGRIHLGSPSTSGTKPVVAHRSR